MHYKIDNNFLRYSLIVQKRCSAVYTDASPFHDMGNDAMLNENNYSR